MRSIWTPQPGPQANAIAADWCPILLYGGAKYGGKSDFLLGDYLQDLEKYGEHWQGIIFRRALTEFTELKLRAAQLCPQAGGVWKEKSSQWEFPNGAILRFRYLERFEQISIYEGHSYPWIGIDELGDWEDQNAFFRILTLNRYGRARIPTLRLRATCNPGGRGHAWIKVYFYDPAPTGYTPLWDPVLNSFRLFIPARLEDNRIGVINDPNYEFRLNRAGSDALVRALRWGDWSVIAGAFFSKFSVMNVLEPFAIPSWWTRFQGHDPGSSDPFCFMWGAVSDGSVRVQMADGKVRAIPSGSIVWYREWYGEREDDAQARVRGLKISVAQKARILRELEHGEEIQYRVAGHDLWEADDGPSDYEKFSDLGFYFDQADTNRKQGWRHMHEYIVGERGIPRAYWFKTCTKSIAHIPSLQHSKRDAEDCEASPFDHAPDANRYGFMSRPYVTGRPPEAMSLEERFANPTLDQMWQRYEQMRRDRR